MGNPLKRRKLHRTPTVPAKAPEATKEPVKAPVVEKAPPVEVPEVTSPETKPAARRKVKKGMLKW